jgi:hypothetical protein
MDNSPALAIRVFRVRPFNPREYAIRGQAAANHKAK